MHSLRSISIIDFSCCGQLSPQALLGQDFFKTYGLSKDANLVAGNYKLSYATEGYDQNMKEISTYIRGKLDHKNLTKEVPPFCENELFTLENLANYLFGLLKDKVKNLAFIELTDGVGDYRVVIKNENDISLYLKFKISATHRLNSHELSQEDNISTYGKCYNKHGHDYYMELGLSSRINEKTGLLWPRDKFTKLVNEQVVFKYDKSFLNDHLENATGEVMVSEFTKAIKSELKKETNIRFTELILRETQKNSFFLKSL